MTEEQADKAHEVYVLYQELVVKVGATLLEPLTLHQREYVIYKMQDEFRFWRVEDQLK